MKSARATPPSSAQPSAPSVPPVQGGALIPLASHMQALLAKVKPPDIVLGAWFNEEMMAATLYAQLAPSENVARVEAAFQRGDGTWERWEP